MQRLALFDLDRTLIDLDAAFFRWAEEFAEHRRLGPEGVAWLLSLDRDGYPHREIFFGKVREHFALTEPVNELWSTYRRRMPHLVRCYPGVLAGLAEMRAEGWRVGIVTNGMADNQLGKLLRTGLADAVDGYAVSGVEGIRKPQPHLFHIAAERCGANLAEGGWMVGDNLASDIEGARTVGLHAIWIDRGTHTAGEHQADHVVTDVIEAIAILCDTQ
ncbi:HAD family hydrolase [Nonomuraea roseoviolacea]|uniref:Hydrolase of the HAD superfamily n=1 Tax=Nonomuraea roseoviolacea subsp. carminata TaxID=160689 RepID=A0ABT1K2C4_9ACTN|nr:HAD family hydrolase [Nonomuraea roseoviolacea]MCP2348153.1 putative hydrolase of the HAD superfamily [Nonomuraea roseoviolacea subsp. carminata]